MHPGRTFPGERSITPARDGWTKLVDERTERSRGMTLELSNWFLRRGNDAGAGCSASTALNSTSPAGASVGSIALPGSTPGGGGGGGFAISMSVLFGKSGAQGQYRRCKSEMLKLAEKDALPGYALAVETCAIDGNRSCA